MLGVGGQEHALRFEAAHCAGDEVGDDDDLFSDEFSRFIVAAQASDDLSLFAAQVDLQANQLIRIGMILRLDDFGYAQVELGEIVVGDGWCRFGHECFSCSRFLPRRHEGHEVYEFKESIASSKSGANIGPKTWLVNGRMR